MEADWEFEIGGDAPVIEAQWPGFVDLREDPRRAWELAEGQLLPGLADALEQMNGTSSPVWTAKTDVFDPGPIDPDEFDATQEEAQHAIACYIDLFLRSDQQWSLPPDAELSCRSLCERLRAIPLRRCRVDLVVRRAQILPEVNDFLAATVYLAACGKSEGDATARLTECLAWFAATAVLAQE